MKKTSISKFVILTALLFVGVLGVNKVVADEASGCEFTDNLADYCYASDGVHNIKVLKCKPGNSSVCSYGHIPE